MKKIILSAVFALLAVPAFASAATLNVVSNSTNAAYYSAVVKAADHLLSQQNTDGGWKWYGTISTPSDENLFGVTGLGLLNAYQLTHDARYLVGASSTAAYLVAKEIPNDFTTDGTVGHKFYSTDIVFLSKMAEVTGNTAYSDKATAVMTHFISDPNRYCANGCATAQDIANYYHTSLSANPGFAEWEISGWAESAKATGQNTLGADLAAIAKNDVLDDTAYASTTNLTQDKYYALGLASALNATALFSIPNVDIKTKLLAEQDGATGAIIANSNDGINQATAYSVLGLSSAGDNSSAAVSVNFLTGPTGSGKQNSDGGWTESDGHEYTEINSEIIQAIFSVLPSNTYYTIQDAINAATSGDTINVGAGNYTEQVNITKPLTLIGAGKDTTHINTPEPSTMTIYDHFGSQSSEKRYNSHRGTNIPVVRIAASDVTFQGFDVNLGDKAFWNVAGSYDSHYSRSTGILVDHVETATGTADTFTNIKIQNNKVDGMLSGDKGDAIKALGNATVSILNNTIYAYGESGISAIGSEDFPSLAPYHPTVTANSNTIYGGTAADAARPGNNYFFGIGYWIGATGSADGNTIYNASTNNSGGALNSWTTMPVSFTHNTITTDGGTVGGVGVQLYQSTALLFSNNTIEKQGLVGITYLNPTVTISGNTITNSTDGFLVDDQTSGSVSINNNSITGIPTGHHAIVVSGLAGVDSGTIFGTWDGPSTITIDGTHNWFGSASSTEFISKIGNSASSTINFTPWYINPGRTTLNTDISGSGTTVTVTAPKVDFEETTDGGVTLPNGVSELTLSNTSVLDFASSTNEKSGTDIMIGGATTSLSTFVVSGATSTVDLSVAQTVGGESVTIGKAVTLSSGSSTQPIILTNSSVSNVSVSIPDSTTILAPSGWDGTIAPPKSVASSGSGPSGFSVGNTVISIGSTDSVLIFDKPVVITLTGVTGDVGYKSAGSNQWVTIGTTCTGTYANPTGAIFPGECKITDGTNTKILTYHFTTFGGLSVLPPEMGGVYSQPTSGGGSGSVSNSASSNTLTPSVTTNVTPAAPIGQVLGASTENTPKGMVLGATAFNFMKDLKIGMKGDDVTELQKILIAEGFLNSEASGYFGSLTKSALAKWQAKNHLPATGFFGPMTRNILSGSTKGVSSNASVQGVTNAAFSRDLKIGMKGDDVTELQKILIAEGFLNSEASGYFGSLTKSALAKWQAKKGVSATGYFGPASRAAAAK